MRKIFLTTMTASLVTFVGTGPTLAQDDGMLVIPVELYTCSYNDRKDSSDLDDVVDKWNALHGQ